MAKIRWNSECKEGWIELTTAMFGKIGFECSDFEITIGSDDDDMTKKERLARRVILAW